MELAPSLEEILERMDELDERGVPVEMECRECDATFEYPVLPEETDERHVTLCKSCMESHLREKRIL